jgi:hypothetical protein
MEEDTGYTDDEDSSSDLGNLSVYENLAPDNVCINEEEADDGPVDGPVDGDDDNDVIEENVSEFTMYTVHMFYCMHERLQLMCIGFKIV